MGASVDVMMVVAVAFLNLYNTLLPIIPEDDDEVLEKVEETVNHINRFIDGEEPLNLDMLMDTLSAIIERVRGLA